MNRFRRMKNRKGFTMIELMVVVVIVAILAAIAIPLYGKYIRNARMTEATGRIGEIITAEKAYAQENDVYTAASTGIVDFTATENFTYAWVGTDPNALATVTATGTTTKVGVGSTVVMTLANKNANGSKPVYTFVN